MSSFRLPLLLVVLVLAATLAPGAGRATEPAPPPAVPETIRSSIAQRTVPLWVSAMRARGRSGGLEDDLFEPRAREFLNRHVERNRDRPTHPLGEPPIAEPRPGIECPEILGPPTNHRLDPRPNRTLPDLVENAIGIFTGTVRRVEQGFFDGLPYSLLQVQIEETLAGEPTTRRKIVYLAYPFARFFLGDDAYCLGLSDTYRPRAGDRILVFQYEPSLDDDVPLFAPERTEMVFETSNGELVSGSAAEHDPDLARAETLEEVETLVRALLTTERTR